VNLRELYLCFYFFANKTFFYILYFYTTKNLWGGCLCLEAPEGLNWALDSGTYMKTEMAWQFFIKFSSIKIVCLCSSYLMYTDTERF
jgi:hypothetical protein